MYNRLKSIRINNKMTQKEIAKNINVTRSSYSVWEAENEIIPLKHLINFCSFFNVSLDYFFGLTSLKQYKNCKNVNYNLVKQRLKDFRKENNLTQVKLSITLNTTQSVIAGYENGKNLISTPFLYTICKKYNISADYLLGKIDEPKYLNSTKK